MWMSNSGRWYVVIFAVDTAPYYITLHYITLRTTSQRSTHTAMSRVMSRDNVTRQQQSRKIPSQEDRITPVRQVRVRRERRKTYEVRNITLILKCILQCSVV